MFAPLLAAAVLAATAPAVAGPHGSLAVDDGGTGGIPVLLVHGLGGDRSVWTAQLAHLRVTRRAVALDLHGFGGSTARPGVPYTMESFAADVDAVAAQLGLRRFVLAGHSMGGAVLAAYAGAHPEKVAGLFFVDPVGDSSSSDPAGLERWLSGFAPARWEAFREQWFGEMLAPAPAAVRQQVLTAMRRVPREVMEASARGLVAFDPKPPLTRFKGPMRTLVTPDNKGPDSLQQVIPGLAAEDFLGTSHWLMLDAPDRFNAALDRFLATVR
jgi:pimeloyl-ACP methyl ester carboxylesterase